MKDVVMFPLLLLLVAGIGLTYVLYTSNTVNALNTITVSFNSITVHNRHEGGSWGDGEYNLFAWVQGKKVDLTRASGPGDGLWDAGNGETLTFNQAYVTTELLDNVPLSIFAMGDEIDRCGRLSYENFSFMLQRLFSDPQRVPEWYSVILNYHRTHGDHGIHCLTPIPGGWNDALGILNEFYQPPNYGAGRHEVKSSSGDFTLRYTISGPDTCDQNIC